jgi:RimJ/RimL family protein N-acetyltransferase
MPSVLDLVIETDRLRLVATSEEYAESILREFTSEITWYMGPKPPERIEETLTFISAARRKMEAGAEFQATVLLNQTGEFLGQCGLHHLERDTPELGIWIKKPAHGHAYGREAVTALAHWAFENLRVRYLIYPVDRENIPSRKIPESLGGRIEAEYRFMNQSGRELDLLVYHVYAPASSDHASPSP